MAQGDFLNKNFFGTGFKSIYYTEYNGNFNNTWVYFMGNVARITMWLWQSWAWNNFANDAHMDGIVQIRKLVPPNNWQTIWSGSKALHSNHGWGGYQVLINTDKFTGSGHMSLGGKYHVAEEQGCMIRIKHRTYGASHGGALHIEVGALGEHLYYDDDIKGYIIRKSPLSVNISNSSAYDANPREYYGNTQQNRGHWIVDSDVRQSFVVDKYLDRVQP